MKKKKIVYAVIATVVLGLFMYEKHSFAEDDDDCYGTLGSVDWRCEGTSTMFCASLVKDGKTITCNGLLISTPDIPKENPGD